MRTGDQAEGLRRLFGRRQTRVASVIGCRPRVGATTLLVNLAAALGASGRAVLVIDARRGLGNVADALGVRPRYELAHALSGDRPLADALARGPEGVTLLPAAQGLPLLGAPARVSRAALAELDRAIESADVVLVDAAPEAAADLALPLGARREVILAAGAGPEAITGAYALVKELATREPEPRVSLAVCGARQETAALTAIGNLAEVAARHLGLHVASLGVLTHDPLFAQAARAGRTVPEVLRRSGAGMQLASIAARFEAAWRVPGPAGRGATAVRAGVPA